MATTIPYALGHKTCYLLKALPASDFIFPDAAVAFEAIKKIKKNQLESNDVGL